MPKSHYCRILRCEKLGQVTGIEFWSWSQKRKLTTHAQKVHEAQKLEEYN